MPYLRMFWPLILTSIGVLISLGGFVISAFNSGALEQHRNHALADQPTFHLGESIVYAGAAIYVAGLVAAMVRHMRRKEPLSKRMAA